MSLPQLIQFPSQPAREHRHDDEQRPQRETIVGGGGERLSIQAKVKDQTVKNNGGTEEQECQHRQDSPLDARPHNTAYCRAQKSDGHHYQQEALLRMAFRTDKTQYCHRHAE